jgi:hypothetical protein
MNFLRNLFQKTRDDFSLRIVVIESMTWDISVEPKYMTANMEAAFQWLKNGPPPPAKTTTVKKTLG